MPRLPWLPPAFPPERSLRQGLAKERKVNKKKKQNTFCTQLTTKKGTKPHTLRLKLQQKCCLQFQLKKIQQMQQLVMWPLAPTQGG